MADCLLLLLLVEGNVTEALLKRDAPSTFNAPDAPEPLSGRA